MLTFNVRLIRRLVVKLGPRVDMGDKYPGRENWQKAMDGCNFAIWERKQDC